MAIETEYTSLSSNRSTGDTGHSSTESLTDTMLDTMVRGPIRLTGATVDFVLHGVQRMTGNDASGSSLTGSSGILDAVATTGEGSSRSTSTHTPSVVSALTGQDLGGDDLKYVFWSILFTKPGEERILQPQQEDLVNYAADDRSYAAVKIAQFLNGSESEIAQEDQKFIEFVYRIDRRLAKREETTRIERVTIETRHAE